MKDLMKSCFESIGELKKFIDALPDSDYKNQMSILHERLFDRQVLITMKVGRLYD